MSDEPTPPSEQEDIKILRDYRDTLQKDIGEKEKEYNTTVTYITGGALALFLTINEKFFNISQAHYKWMLFASLLCLLLCMLMHVLANIIDVTGDKELLNKTDAMIEKQEYDDVSLTTEWKKWLRRYETIYYTRFGLMILGVVLEAFFITLNLNAAKDNAAAKTPVVSQLLGSEYVSPENDASFNFNDGAVTAWQTPAQPKTSPKPPVKTKPKPKSSPKPPPKHPPTKPKPKPVIKKTPNE
ncbi:MAG: hypothetical protein JST68_20455 [Bacteroidetes bacterium]|nr:hypothetical protein [Bacteroidota bacterium]